MSFLGPLSLQSVAPPSAIFSFVPGRSILWSDWNLLHSLAFCLCPFYFSTGCLLSPLTGGSLSLPECPVDRWNLCAAPHFLPPQLLLSALDSRPQFHVTESHSDPTLGGTCPFPVKGISCHLWSLQQALWLSLDICPRKLWNFFSFALLNLFFLLLWNGFQKSMCK